MATREYPPPGRRISTEEARAVPDTPARPSPGAIPTPAAGYVAVFASDENTDVLHIGQPALGKVAEREREYIITVLSGPQTGLHRVIDQGSIIIGRAPGCDFLLEDTALSRRHCRIFRAPEGLAIEDLGSSNGTFVDGRLVRTRQSLEVGARINLGRQTVLSLSRQDSLEQSAARRLYESAMRDPLTGVYNRRCLDQRLREEFAYAQRHRSTLSLLMLDLDHFKRINDGLGHPAGDAVLRHLGEIIPRYLRKEDVAARYGGEEFSVLVRSIGADGARALGERIRQRIEAAPVAFERHTIAITASVGVATLDAERFYQSAAALLAAADAALYLAKTGGRNRVCDDRG
jgi:diguanylate cyclase (GGDEF)-like protein